MASRNCSHCGRPHLRGLCLLDGSCLVTWRRWSLCGNTSPGCLGIAQAATALETTCKAQVAPAEMIWQQHIAPRHVGDFDARARLHVAQGDDLASPTIRCVEGIWPTPMGTTCCSGEEGRAPAPERQSIRPSNPEHTTNLWWSKPKMQAPCAGQECQFPHQRRGSAILYCVIELEHSAPRPVGARNVACKESQQALHSKQ
mmetsp:Transcript_61594/g.198340  ORF Transcript_61594/g.198340 Transcript_61594/m.198340 type:complete len:200 (-) Transcript_61594:234-833(-)